MTVRRAPLPGRKVRGSTTGHPTMALLDLLGRRWTLRVLWALHDSPATFRDLQDRCDGMSPSVLNQRIAELKVAQIVETSGEGYRLTAHGSELLELLAPLSRWSKRWARRMEVA
jgi:DNA-binding HxlR family transcriptional regulator